MERGPQQFPHLGKRRVLEFPYGPPDIRNHDPRNRSPSPYSPGPVLKNRRRDPGFFRVRKRSKSALEDACGHRLD